jgi:hypothetical protein
LHVCLSAHLQHSLANDTATCLLAPPPLQIYGKAVPNNNKVQAALQQFPMLTQAQASQASAALGWNAFFASRMNSRYLANVASMSFTLANGKQAANPVTFTQWNGVVNLVRAVEAVDNKLCCVWGIF